MSDTLFVNAHDHLMFEYAIREAVGETNIFDTHYAPVLRRGGIDVIVTSVGGNSPCTCNLTDDLLHGALEQIDMLRRAEEESASFRICESPAAIQECVAEGKIAVVLAFEGARAMEGLPFEESLVLLRTLHRLGLRVNCIVGGGRTRFASGMGDARSGAGLTTFGVKLIEEMNRIGMLVDLTHMTDNSFFDSLEVSSRPVLVSHIGVQALCPNPNNLSDERIRALGKNGGVIGMEMVKTELKWRYQESSDPVTFDTVVDHIDHIVDLVGIDHVGIGLDFDRFELVDNIHRAMCPGPGSIEGFYTGVPEGSHMLDDPQEPGEAWKIADYLSKRGYGDGDIRKILGDNMLRLLRETLV